MSDAATAQQSDRELVSALRAFPIHVLPIGVLRELARRGRSVDEELVRPLQEAIDNAGKGIGWVPGETFFCFGLLLARAGVHLLPLLEGLLRLKRDQLDRLLGDFANKGTISMLVAIAKENALADVLAWIDRMIEDDSIDPWSRMSCLSALPYLVRDVGLDRNYATDRLVAVLLRREATNYDTLSAAALIELSNLGAVEFESFVMQCFERGQIDEDLYRREDWIREATEWTTWQYRLEQLHPISFDIVEIVQWWYGFPQLSHDLDPWNAKYETNPVSHQGFHARELSDAQIDANIEAIRNSNDNSFPRAAVQELDRHATQVADRLIAEVRRGMSLVGGPDVRSSNGPYLALMILVANEIRIPRDLLLEILDLPEDDRMSLFGDSSDSALMNAASLSLLGDTRPIDERILDCQRSQMERDALADFYLLSAWRGFLPRGEAIERLMELWRSVQDEPPDSRPTLIFESLCIMSPQDYKPELLQALDEGMSGWRITPTEIREILEYPSRGERCVHEQLVKENRNVMKMIESSVMFDREALDPPKPVLPVATSRPKFVAEPLLDRSSTTVRNTTSRAGRNDPCPCGSGKKYKKCCARS
jgi:hypothetical protein